MSDICRFLVDKLNSPVDKKYLFIALLLKSDCSDQEKGSEQLDMKKILSRLHLFLRTTGSNSDPRIYHEYVQ
jgi:hypothetical protein